MIKALSLALSFTCAISASAQSIRGSALASEATNENLRKHAERAMSLPTVSVAEGEDVVELDNLVSGYFVAVDYFVTDTTCSKNPVAVSSLPLNTCIRNTGTVEVGNKVKVVEDSAQYYCALVNGNSILTINEYINTTDCSGVPHVTQVEFTTACNSTARDGTTDRDNWKFYCTAETEPWTGHGSDYLLKQYYDDDVSCNAETNSVYSFATFIGACVNGFVVTSCSDNAYSTNHYSEANCTGSMTQYSNAPVDCSAPAEIDEDYETTQCFVTSESSSDGGKKNVCFSADSLVAMHDGSTKRIADVEVGDRIMTLSSDGVSGFSDVAFVVHESNTEAAQFVTIRTAAGQSLKVTPEHIVPAGTCAPQASLASMPLVRASAVRVGDCVYTPSGQQKVVFTSVTQGEGIYSVVTTEMSGMLVVDGIAASSFGSSHKIVNAYYNLHRAMYSIGASVITNNRFAQRANALFGDLAAFVGHALNIA